MLKCVLLVVLGTDVMCYRIIDPATPKPHTFQKPNTPSVNNWKYSSDPSQVYYWSHSEHWNYQSGSHWQETHEPNGRQSNEPSQTNATSYFPSNISPVANPSSQPIETSETGQTNQTHESTVAGYMANTELSKTNQTASQSPNNQTRNNTDRDTEPVTPSTPRSRWTTPKPISGSHPVFPLGKTMAPSLQYHVAIYSKESTPYEQICGGSLVKADVVLSAAHCFWSDDEGVRPAALYAVAAGKLLRTYDALEDSSAQYSDIAEIKVPPRFRGVMTSFQDDIAVLRLTTPLEYAPGVKPLCVDFDLALDRYQLQDRNEGTVTGWGLTTRNGGPSLRLNFAKVPALTIELCLFTASPTFLKYITSDKICAGAWGTGQALCRGDSGGGLVYFNNSVPYIRGIASTAPRDNNQCNIDAVATFTHIRSHMTFLTDHVPDIADECKKLYDIEETPATASAGTENVTQAVLADAVTESATQAVVADAVTENATQTFVADAVTESATQAVVADAVTESATQAAVVDAVAENATQAVLADSDNERLTQAVVVDAVETRTEERNVAQVCQCPEILEMKKYIQDVSNVTSSFFDVDEFKVTFNVKGGRITLLWDSSF